MAKSKGRSGAPAVVDIELNEDLGEQTQEVLDQEWIVAARDTRTPFFDALQDIPEGGWDKCSIYLYRLDPAVSNKQGDKKYIAVYGAPISEEGVKQEHGGGKYHAYLKYGKETLRNHRFSIEGQPIFIEGQTPRGAVGAPGAAAPQQSDLANVVRQVIDATKGDQTAANAGIEVLKSAMKDGLALNKTILEAQIGSTTGSKMGDKVLDMLLPRLLDQKQPELPPIVTKFLDAAISLVKNPREQTVTAQTNPMEQLNFVKDLLGVDSIKDLFDQGRRSTEQPFWVPLISNAIEKLPGLFHEYAEMQERAFQRALIAHQARGGQALPASTIGTAPVMGMGAIPAPSAPAETAEQQAQRMIGTIVEAICRAWDEGYPGDVAGAHLKIGYPQLVEQLKPLLADPTQLSSFIASVPALAERATDPEWPEFQGDLIGELNQVPMPPGVEPPAEPASVAPPAAGATAPAAVDSAPPPAKKRKANGHAA